MPDPEIQATIARIDQRIAKLEKIRELLIEEFGQAEGAEAVAPVEQRRFSTGGVLTIRKADSSPTLQLPLQAEGSKESRRETIIAFLKAVGSAPRRDIIEATGIPAGTVSYELNDKTVFTRDSAGNWGLVASAD
jgi:hypothetical protein